MVLDSPLYLDFRKRNTFLNTIGPGKYLKKHILCLLAGVIRHDGTQYAVVAHNKGWSHLSDYEVIITV